MQSLDYLYYLYFETLVSNIINSNCERWIIQHDTSVGKRKYLSPRQELNPWPPEHMVGLLSTELQELMESKGI